MIWKSIKYGVLALVAGAVIGGVVFGRDLASYVSSSAGAVREAVKESVPVEFELRRARDLLDQIIPEMHANIRLIAQEEVEIASLEDGIEHGGERLEDEAERIAALRSMLDSPEVRFTVHGRQYDRADVREELGRRLDRIKEAKVVLASKRRVLEARQKSLAAAQETLDRTRSQKALLEDRIEALASQHRMIQAASVGTRLELDNSKLAQTEQLIEQIRKRLEVAERVLAHEARFTEPIPVETVSEEELLTEVDAFLADEGLRTAPQPGEAVSRADELD